MMTSSNGNIFRVTGLLFGEFTGVRWIPRTKASDAELWCFLDLRLNKRLSKQSWGWWFETLSRPLWRHCNDHKAPINGPSWSLGQSSINSASIDLTLGFVSEISNPFSSDKLGYSYRDLFYQFIFYKYSDRRNMICHPESKKSRTSKYHSMREEIKSGLGVTQETITSS